MRQEPNPKKIYPRTNDFSTVYLKFSGGIGVLKKYLKS